MIGQIIAGVILTHIIELAILGVFAAIVKIFD